MGLFFKKFSIIRLVLFIVIGIIALYLIFRGIINQNI